MRFSLLLMPIGAIATSALAAPPPENIQIPPQLSDPQLADRLTDTMVALSKTFLNLPVGDVEAALDGRKPTSADKRRTVRTETGMSERELDAKIEASRPAIHAGQKALVAALPALIKGVSDAEKEFERATANLPQPGYPNR